MLTLGSLFDGIGGWQLAAVEAGIRPVWASEIDDYPASVTAHHFPETKQLGDVTRVDSSKIEPVDIVCAGSPCQDLSIAGKRAGLNGERSGLFGESIRIIREMRKATNGEYPKWFVWENVPGAFTSNKGADFRTVLEEITESKIPVPKSGRWAKAGMVRSPKCDIAWRTLDAQYWGVPQRRARIFLVADFRKERRAEVLFKPKSLWGDSTQGKGKGQDSAGSFRESTEPANRTWNISGYNSNSMKSDNPYSGIGETDKARTLDLNGGNPACNQGGVVVLEGNGNRPSHKGDGYRVSGTSYTLNTIERHGVAYGFEPGITAREGRRLNKEISTTLRENMGDNQESVVYGIASQSYSAFKETDKATTLKVMGGNYGGGSENLAVEVR